jgi:glycosyltransferase involved in cell wall biosynthesis
LRPLEIGNLHIVHVISGYLPDDWGGTQLHLRDLCKEQQAKGHRVEIFARSGSEGEDFEVFQDSFEGVPVTRIRNNFSDVDRLEKLYHHPIIDAKFKYFLQTQKPDLVHVHHLTCLSSSMIDVSHSLGLPVVMTLHDFWMQCPRGQRIHPETMEICETLDRKTCRSCMRNLWPHLIPKETKVPFLSRILGKRQEGEEVVGAWDSFMKGVLSRCQALIFPATFHRDRFLEWGLDPKICKVVPHGLNKEAIPFRPRGKGPVRHIGFIGSVIPSKGVDVLLRAFRVLVETLEDVELRLEIHGKVMDFHGDLCFQDELDSLGGKDGRVTFHGAYESKDLPGILESLDLLVIPSIWWETFCLTAREGALAGIPVVGTDLAGIGEAVREGLILGFKKGDVSDLVCQLKKLFENPELRDRMSHKRDLVRSMVDCAEETMAIYQSVLESS